MAERAVRGFPRARCLRGDSMDARLDPGRALRDAPGSPAPSCLAAGALPSKLFAPGSRGGGGGVPCGSPAPLLSLHPTVPASPLPLSKALVFFRKGNRELVAEARPECSVP